MESLDQIGSYLADVRKRAQLLHIIRCTGVSLCILTLLALLLLLASSFLESSAPPRVFGLSMLFLLALGYLIHMGLGIRRLSDVRQVVRLIGNSRPTLHGDLLSTMELEQRLAGGQARFSPSLFGALAHRTWHRLKQRPPCTMVPRSLLRPTAMLLTITALIWGAAAAGLSDQVTRGVDRLFTGTARGAKVSPRLMVGDLKLTYHYPRYMARPDRVVDSSTGHITAPRGTRIALQATTLIPATRVVLVLRHRGSSKPRRLKLTLRSSRALAGGLTLQRGGTYRFEVLTPDGEVSLDPMVRRVQLVPDTPPKVMMYGPREGLEITRHHRLEVAFTAEDDHGVTRVDLVHQISAQAPNRLTLWKPKPGKRHTRMTAGKHDWDLGIIDLYPGARVSYWIEVHDNDTISGPKVGRSSTQHFRIYSAEKKHDKTINHHELLVERGLRILADRLLLFAAEPPISPVLRLSKNLTVHRATGSLADGLRELRNRMRKDSLVSRTTLSGISALGRQIDAPLRVESTLLKQLEGARRKRKLRPARLSPLREHNRKLVAVMEKLVLRLANLLDEQRLQSLMNLHRNLQKARSRLADLLRRYRKTQSPQLRKEILRQILEMEQKVKQLMERAAKVNRSVPHEYLNAEAMAQIDALSDLRSIANMVQRGKLSSLDASLQALDKKLNQLQNMLSGNLQQFRGGRMNPQEKAYSALLDRLRGLEDEQRRVARTTRRIIRRYHKRAAKLMRHKINPFVQREQKKLSRLRKLVGEIDASRLAPYDQEQLGRIKQRIRDLKGMLDQGDLDQALRMALRTRNGLQVLQDDLAEEVEGRRSRRSRRVIRALKKTRASGRLAEEIVSDLKSVFPSPRTLLDRKDRRDLRSLLRRQKLIQRKLNQLGGRLGKGKGKGATLQLGAEIVRGVSETGELMTKASRKLKSMQPQEAHGSQEAAAERLAQLRKQTQASRQPRQWSRSGPSVLKERIRIPGADAFRPPKEFRRDILEAMKEKAPDAYRRQVKRYYEELVR